MELNFKKYLEGNFGLNAPGRAGQHIWKPETPILNDPAKPNFKKPTNPLKGTDLNTGFRPGFLAPFKGMSGEKFGIKVKRVPKPSES